MNEHITPITEEVVEELMRQATSYMQLIDRLRAAGLDPVWAPETTIDPWVLDEWYPRSERVRPTA
jgi:hypothetical protein